MFPLKDNVPTRSFPIVTLLLIAANAAVWIFYQLPEGVNASALELAYQPCEVNDTCPPGGAMGEDWPITSLTSMFMHGSWLHIIGNMWFLWVFGDNVEETLGHARFLLFYLISGFAAAAAQVLADPGSAVPMVGASGAIGGVMGAYAVLFPRSRVDVLFFFGFYVRVIPMAAFFMLGYWFVIQLVSGSMGGGEGGVAFWAHVGGFAAGAAMVLPLRARRLQQA
jgi:membrane associated rhomboid family serine protease